MNDDRSDPVERHRAALEALAEHGRTELAEDARQLLEAADAAEGGVTA